jgi:hypothetical protein
VRQEARDGGVGGAEAGGVLGGERADGGREEGRTEERARLEKLSELVTKSWVIVVLFLGSLMRGFLVP